MSLMAPENHRQLDSLFDSLVNNHVNKIAPHYWSLWGASGDKYGVLSQHKMNKTHLGHIRANIVFQRESLILGKVIFESDATFESVSHKIVNEMFIMLLW